MQRRYFQLRSQLSGLNYSCNFGLDALDVVQELFTDLVSTTESYSLLQEKETKLSHDLAVAQTHLLPLRKEIGRLTKENHHFHLDNIRIKEESVEEISKLIAESQKAQLDATELRHVVYVKDMELQKAEAERIRIREVGSYTILYFDGFMILDVILFELSTVPRPTNSWRRPLCRAPRPRSSALSRAHPPSQPLITAMGRPTGTGRARMGRYRRG